MQTISEKYVNARIGYWRKLLGISSKLSTGKTGNLSQEEIQDYPRLYRQVCADLAEAKMRKLSPDVISYLNSIVGKAHRSLYNLPPIKSGDVRDFFVYTLPCTVINNWQFVVSSMILFLLPFIISGIVVYYNPELASLAINQGILDSMELSYQEAIEEDRGIALGSRGVSYYIQHNVSIGFASFASGILFGLGTIYFLLYNGIALGCIMGYVSGLGYGKNLIGFVTAHSCFELTGLVLAGAAGLMLGYAIVNRHNYTFKDWLNMQKKKIFTMICAAAILITLAAFIEGLLSPSPAPYAIKLFVALASLTGIVSYFILYPLLKLKKQTSSLEEESNVLFMGKKS